LTSLADNSVGAGVDLSGNLQVNTGHAIINANVSKSSDSEEEEAIAIDPTNPQRMFVASNLFTSNFPQGLFGAYSTDAGATWNKRIVGTGSDGLPLAFGDPTLSWDQFGNLFIGYISQT